LEAGAEIAAAIHAELRGMFIEDENLLRTAELPITRAVSRSGRVDLLDEDSLLRGLRRHAEIARRALERIAGKMQLAWSFSVVRGSVAGELLRAAALADIVTLGRSGWSARAAGGLGSTTRSLLVECPASLLFIEEGYRLEPPLAVLYDASPASRRAVGLAASLIRGKAGPIIVLLDIDVPGNAEGEAETFLRESGVSNVKFHHVSRTSRGELVQVLLSSRAKSVLIPASTGMELPLIAQLLERTRCCALIVR
jgi:nucleotide-binding universal stress UspA family protein